MLNRRRQTHDNTEGSNGEGQALLVESHNEVLDHHDIPSNRRGYAISYPTGQQETHKRNHETSKVLIDTRLQSQQISSDASIQIHSHSPHIESDRSLVKLNSNHHEREHSSIDVDSNRYHSQNFVYYNVQPGDTLQNLSVRYSCPVATIKRLNNLWSDQEFHARSRLKLPVGRLRLITDVIDQRDPSEKVDKISGTTPIQSLIEPPKIAGWQGQYVDDKMLARYSSSSGDYIDSRSDLVTDQVFKNLDEKIEKAKAAAQAYDAHARAIMQTLADNGNVVQEFDNICDLNNLARREAETLLIDMSDSGLSYSGLILFMFIVCLICPLAYVIYLEETTVHSQDHNKAL